MPFTGSGRTVFALAWATSAACSAAPETMSNCAGAAVSFEVEVPHGWDGSAGFQVTCRCAAKS